jgi:hypothetical protein
VLDDDIQFLGDVDNPMEELLEIEEMILSGSAFLLVINIIVEVFHKFDNFALEGEYFDEVARNLVVYFFDYFVGEVLLEEGGVGVFFGGLRSAVGRFLGGGDELGGHVDVEDFLSGEFGFDEFDEVEVLFVVGHDDAGVEVAAHGVEGEDVALDGEVGGGVVGFWELS